MAKIPGIVLFGLCITAHFGILQKTDSELENLANRALSPKHEPGSGLSKMYTDA